LRYSKIASPSYLILKQGLIEQAIDSYQQALNLEPNYCEVNYIEVYKNMRLIFELQGQLENALACCQQAGEQPMVPYHAFISSTVSWGLGRLVEASQLPLPTA